MRVGVAVIGVLLGGVLTEALGWEAVFLVNVPLVGVAMLLAFGLIAPDGERGLARGTGGHRAT
jgi:hypothetical protein